MSPPIYTPDGQEVTEIVLPDGSTASEVVAPDGSVVFEAGPDIPDSALTQDLVAWYRFEDGDARDYTATLDATFADSTAYDGTVNGATYQSSGGVADFESGANSGAFDFDGSGDNIHIPNVSVPTSNFTVCAWVKVDTIDSGDNGILGRASNELQFDFNDADSLRIYSENASFETPTTQSEWDDGYHWAAVKQEPNGDVTIFRDDNILGSGNVGAISGEFGFIGQIESGRDFDGLIDDVRIYNRALTDAEMFDIYNTTEP